MGVSVVNTFNIVESKFYNIDTGCQFYKILSISVIDAVFIKSVCSL